MGSWERWPVGVSARALLARAGAQLLTELGELFSAGTSAEILQFAPLTEYVVLEYSST